jgi:hypothetical protein
LIVAAAGVVFAFVLNAISFLGVIFVIFMWKRPAKKSKLPAETLGAASVAAIRYVRYSPGLRTLMARSGFVIFFASSFWALLPTVAKGLSKSPLGYGFLLGCFGLGAVLGAVALESASTIVSTEAVISVATAIYGAILICTGALHHLLILCGLMLLGGAAWTVLLSTFNTMVQNLAPEWVRARVLAAYLFVFQGSVALGSMLWGLAAEHASARTALMVSGLGIGATILLRFPLPLPSTAVDLRSWNHWTKPGMFEQQDPDQGPVLVTVQYVIDPARSADFLRAMYRYQRIRRRDGATRWGIFYDMQAAHVYLETFLVDSWAEHERQHDRFTVADRGLEERVLSFALETPSVRHYIHAERE